MQKSIFGGLGLKDLFWFDFSSILASFWDPKVDHFRGDFWTPEKEGDPDRGEVEDRSRRDQAAARGGVGEGFTPLPL